MIRQPEEERTDMAAEGQRLDLDLLCGQLQQREGWLVERVVQYANLHGYARYTPPLTEAWRRSIHGLTQSVLRASESYDEAPELCPDEDIINEPISAFGIQEAQRHRARGITLAMFLGLFKYFRQAYADCLADLPLQGAPPEPYLHYLNRVFDRVEISYCQEWANVSGGDRLAELQTTNRLTTNEKNRYLTLFESLPDPVLLLDVDLKLENANHAAQILMGLPRGTSGEAYYGDLPGMDDFSELLSEVARFTGSGDAERTFDLSVTRGGEATHYSIQLTLMLDVSGKFSGVIVHLADVTSDRQARAELIESEQRYRAMFDGSSDAHMLAIPDDGFLDCNPACLELFGCSSREQFTRLSPAMISPPLQPGGETSVMLAQERMLTAMERGSLEFEWVHMHKDGGTFEANVRLTRMEVQGREVLLATVRDISRSKALEREVAEAMEQLRRSNEDLAQFAYIASHDLTEPLRAVSSFLQLLQKRYQGELDERADKYIHFAVDGAGRMGQLLEDLLKFSRVGTRGREPAPVEPGDALDRALENLTSAVQERGAEVIRGDLPKVMADFSQLVQLMQNLVGNGIKFQPPGQTPRVEVSGRRDGPMVELSVRDNGIGILPEHAARIFEVFKRLHTREEFPGSGIGLAICKKIVERHGGAMEMESTPGEGTEFRFTLPAAEE